MDTVWIVLMGEYAEGGEVKAVFPTLSSAMTHAARIVPPGGGAWWSVPNDGRDDNRKCEWRSGCDVLRIERHKVQS